MATIQELIARAAAAQKLQYALQGATNTNQHAPLVGQKDTTGAGAATSSKMQQPANGIILKDIPPAPKATLTEIAAICKVQQAGGDIATVQPASGIILNAEQMLAKRYAVDCESFVLVGAAGTGKTTTLAACATQLLTAYKPEQVAMVAYTNTAAKNIGRAMSKYPELKEFAKTRCSTIHRLLGFRPVPYSYENDDGMLVDSMRFEPEYDAANPLLDITLVIVEEASMLGLDLWKMLRDATPNATYVFVGDLNQIPPVFGDSILGYKLLELPVIELTQVYRQAMDSPIVGFQHKFTLAGNAPGDSLLPKDGALQFLPMRTFIKDPDKMCAATASYFKMQFAEGKYNPQDDMILMPFNKAFGTIGLNTLIAQFLGEHRGAVVHEVVAGFEKHYYAEGDRVRYKKEEYVITGIKKNHMYRGVEPQEPSAELTRLGTYKSAEQEALAATTADEEWDFNELLQQVDSDDGTAKNACSHILELTATLAWEGEAAEIVTVQNRGELNNMDFGYAMTIHKSQGSEWRKVYLIMTKHHAVMGSRELLYTGMTRAREELVVMYSPASAVGKKDSSVSKAICNPRISGFGWMQKRKQFAAKMQEYLAHMAQGANGLSRDDMKLLTAVEQLLAA